MDLTTGKNAPEDGNLIESMGVTEERFDTIMENICDKMQELPDSMKKSDAMKVVIEHCDTPEELTLAAWWFGRKEGCRKCDDIPSNRLELLLKLAEMKAEAGDGEPG